MADFISDEDSESEILQELYVAGKLKPGLNVPVEKKISSNNVQGLKDKLDEIKSQLTWIERFDIVNEFAAVAPELSVELNEQEEFVKSGRIDSLAFNEFKRETLFHRQAQLAVIEGIARMRSQGVLTIRPDDYFAEMMKSDAHMQKVRHSLLQKQVGLERSEKVKKIRTEKKFAKQKQVDSTLRKQKEKRNLTEEIKKYRKGIRTDLNFLENKSSEGKSKEFNAKRKKEKYGFGGKKKNKFNKQNFKNKRSGRVKQNKRNNNN